MNGWIGVDYDGTLVDELGQPVSKMVRRIRRWLAAGEEVRIVTARASSANRIGRSTAEMIEPVERMCLILFGRILPITCEKDFNMVELWDDRAVQVIPNTGERADGKV